MKIRVDNLNPFCYNRVIEREVNKMKKKVWVLLQEEECIGAYGTNVETQIMGIFTTKEKAEEELKRIKQRFIYGCDFYYERPQ